MSEENPTATPGRVLALDLGQRRIGVAVSDPARSIAQPLTVLNRVNRDQDLAAIARLCREQGAGLVVLGLAEPLEGQTSPMAEQAKRMGQRLARLTGLPVEYVDESESTVEAQELLLAADTSRTKRKHAVDKLAAAIILRRWLDRPQALD